MNIQMVGTGSAFAKKHYNNNALIKSGGKTILLDCGITLPHALYELGYNFGQLDAVLISHIHADHVGGLEELAFQMLFNYNRKPVLYIAEPLISPLWEHTLRGGLTQGELTSLSDFFEVRPLKPNEYAPLTEELSVMPIQTAHIPGKPSYSFLINDRFFYSADMQFDRKLLELLHEQGVETFFHDCQLEPPGNVHACLDELLTLPDAIQQKMWLMHYGDAISEYIGKTGAMRIVEQGKMYSF